MVEKILYENKGFRWVDFEDPSPQDLEAIGKRFSLHESSIQDCLDPEHLPKHELINSVHLLILRAPEDSPPKNGISVQDLSRKIAIFAGPEFVITIHRASLRCVSNALVFRPLNSEAPSENHSTEILTSITASVLYHFEKAIDSLFVQLDELEASVFSVPGSKVFKLKTAYYFKRRNFVFKMIVKLTRDAISKFSQSANISSPAVQDLKENCDSLYFYVDELYENINTLINLHVSLATQKTTEASYKTGEIVRILTIFSIFLLPLNVITGIYGMNFENMPELKMPWGYPMALMLMISVFAVVYYWMHRKGWLKS